MYTGELLIELHW